jgi:hypothetical protein
MHLGIKCLLNHTPKPGMVNHWYLFQVSHKQIYQLAYDVKYIKFKKSIKGNECNLCYFQNHRQELRNLLMNVQQQKSDEVRGQMAPFLTGKQLFA